MLQKLAHEDDKNERKASYICLTKGRKHDRRTDFGKEQNHLMSSLLDIMSEQLAESLVPGERRKVDKENREIGDPEVLEAIRLSLLEAQTGTTMDTSHDEALAKLLSGQVDDDASLALALSLQEKEQEEMERYRRTSEKDNNSVKVVPSLYGFYGTPSKRVKVDVEEEEEEEELGEDLLLDSTLEDMKERGQISSSLLNALKKDMQKDTVKGQYMKGRVESKHFITSGSVLGE